MDSVLEGEILMARETTGSHRAGFYLLGALLLAFYHPLLGAKDPKIKAEELVAKHLESIGTAEARAAAKNRTASGVAQVTFHMPKPGQLGGIGTFLSEGRMMRIAMKFGAPDHQGEQFVFDGKSVDVGQLRLRVRSHLAQFVYDHSILLKEGLMGGTMTTAWPLLDLAGRQPKLDYTGLKKVDGKSLLEVKYRAKKDPGDVQVALYFDPETFRHVYSEYRLIVRAMMVQGKDEMGKTLPDTSSQNDAYYKIQEWFDDFRTVDSLSLPHGYKLSFNRRGSGEAVIFDYSNAFTQILHNQAIDPKAFVIQ